LRAAAGRKRFVVRSKPRWQRTRRPPTRRAERDGEKLEVHSIGIGLGDALATNLECGGHAAAPCWPQPLGILPPEPAVMSTQRVISS